MSIFIEQSLSALKLEKVAEKLEEGVISIEHSNLGVTSEPDAATLSEPEISTPESQRSSQEHEEPVEIPVDDDGYESSAPEHEIIPTSEEEEETNSNPWGVSDADAWGEIQTRDDTYFQQEGWKEVGLSHEESLALEKRKFTIHVPKRLQCNKPGRVNKCLRDIYLEFPNTSRALHIPSVRNVKNIHISVPAHFKVTTFYCQHRSLSILKEEIFQTTLGTSDVIQVQDTRNVVALLHYTIPPQPVVLVEVNGYLGDHLVPRGVTWVDSEEEYTRFLTYLHRFKKNQIELALDCEASRGLSRKGNVTHLTISSKSLDHTWVLCHTKLSPTYFDIPDAASGISLRAILEDPEIQQLWFDVRSDSDALFGIYGIGLGCVIDVQLMEVAARYGATRLDPNISSLKHCMSRTGYNFLSQDECDQWLWDKREGKEFFDLHGWEILEMDPLPEQAKDYTAGDTYILFGLYDQYQKDCEFIGSGLDVDLQELVEKESRIRVEKSRDPNYEHDSRPREEKVAAPAAFLALDFVGVDGERISRDLDYHRVMEARFFGGEY